MLMEEGICVLSPCIAAQCAIAGITHFKSVVQGAFFCSEIQLYVDLEKTAFRSEGHQIFPSALCSVLSQTH